MQIQEDYREFIRNSIQEIELLLQKTEGVQDFLDNIVEKLTVQMKSSVCSVYLYDSQRESLILRATRGLNPELINRLQLKSGKGIIGHCFEQMFPLRVDNVRHNPYYRAIHNSFEEQYISFLAVPIRRGTESIGVISLQHEDEAYFSVQDGVVLKAIAYSLALVLEEAEFIMEFADQQSPEHQLAKEYTGRGIGHGIYIARAEVLKHQHFAELDVSEDRQGDIEHEKNDVVHELTRFARSLQKTKEELEDIQKSLINSIDEVADLIFAAHLLILRDSSFSDAMQAKIHEGRSAETAIKQVVNKYIQVFANQANPRIQEKVQDLSDLATRLLKNLDIQEDEGAQNYAGKIIISANIYPSEMLRFAAEKVQAVVIVGGGETAHIALLAKSLQIPTIFTHEGSILELRPNTLVIVDLHGMRIFTNPDEEKLQEYGEKQGRLSRLRVLDISVPERTRTKDNKRVNILANVNLVQDVSSAIEHKAEGIGLYRSEFPFLVRNDFLSEEEQTEIYKKIIEPMGKKKIILRTLDIGGDKLVGINSGLHEENPFLGYRGIRFSLNNVEIFSDQIRAILRAAAQADIGILFPMVSSLEEFTEARNIVYRCMEALAKERIPFCEKPEFGAMIEVPAAVEIAPELAEASDFLSIGTNDLIMYLLAVDRTNEMVENLFVPYHPAVLAVLYRLTQLVGSKLSRLSICGEAAANPALIPFFLGIGIHTLSLEPGKIPVTKEYISKIQLSKTIQLADYMLNLKTRTSIESFIEEEILSEKFLN